jgi:hypothetical protein
MNYEIRLAILRTLPFLIVIGVILLLIYRKKVPPQDLDIRRPLTLKSFYMYYSLNFYLIL